jgi:hypothetical protein
MNVCADDAFAMCVRFRSKARFQTSLYKAFQLICLFFSYGTAKSGVGVSAMSVLRPDLMMKCVIPVVMAGIIGVCIPASS